MVARDAEIAVYIMANGRNGAVYTGVTSQLVGRVLKHKRGTFDGHTKNYGITRLVGFDGLPGQDFGSPIIDPDGLR